MPGVPPKSLPSMRPAVPEEVAWDSQLNSGLPGCLYGFASSERNYHCMLLVSPKFELRRGSLHCDLTLAKEIVTISEIAALK
jgi:hypothetical protein